MIDRNQIRLFLDVLERLQEEDAKVTIDQGGKIDLTVYPKEYWRDGQHWGDEKRHEMLALITPLVGRLDKHVDGRNIGYRGEKENVTIRLAYVDQCRILGYKTVTKTVKKEIDRVPEYEEVEEEQRVAITDCDIRQGKYSENDIEEAS